MAKLYGLGNVIISEVLTRLMTNPDFYKLVYYKDVDENGEDILSMPDLEDPVGELYKKQVWLHKECLLTPNGSRDIALLCCVSDIVENDDYFRGLGRCSVYRVNHLLGLGMEYSGYEVTCRIDGIQAKGI